MNGIRHGFFTRRGGVSQGPFDSLNCGLTSGDEIERVKENRRRVAEKLAIAPENLLTCKQVHSPDIVTVAEPFAARPAADAMVTNRPGIMLGILTADCVPILLADEKARVIGAAHAGWRGAVTGVIENVLKAMSDLGARPENIIAAIGPCIWQNSYEVGPEFPAPFLALDQANEKFFKLAARGDHFMFDLPGYVMARLKALGVALVAPSPADTLSDPDRFFSYRRVTLGGGGPNGSLISGICLDG